jgi:hypothetical protein
MACIAGSSTSSSYARPFCLFKYLIFSGDRLYSATGICLERTYERAALNLACLPARVGRTLGSSLFARLAAVPMKTFTLNPGNKRH